MGELDRTDHTLTTGKSIAALTPNPPVRTVRVMEVVLSANQQAAIDEAIRSGRAASGQDVINKALALWAQQERDRREMLAELQEADRSIDLGEGIEISEASIRDLIEGTKKRGRERLAAEFATTG